MIRIFLRQFLLQAHMNHRGMQHEGLLYALLPTLPEDATPQMKQEFMTRHREYFNAHPWLASWAIGIIGGMELKQDPPEKIGQMKSALITPLGSLGDRLFWNLLKPISGLVAMIGNVAGLLGHPHIMIGGWILAVLALNLPHLFVRWHGLRCGLSNPERAAVRILKLKSSGIFRRLRVTAAVLLGVFVAFQAALLQMVSFRFLLLTGIAAFGWFLLSRWRKPVWMRLLILLPVFLLARELIFRVFIS